jgi:methionyl aminopeptidase
MQPVDLTKMRAACRAAAETLRLAGSLLRVGMTTDDIDRVVREDTFRRGGRPAPYNYHGFPKSVCTSVNDVVCHGIPGPYVLKDGDIVNVDVTTILDGHFGDTNSTFFVGTPSTEALRLVTEVTQPAMWVGIRQIKPGVLLGAVGRAIQQRVEAQGCSVVREFGGHGIGRRFHDTPHVNHFGNGTEGPVLKEGDLLTVEPMVNLGGREVYVEADGWTVRTKDGSLSAQAEHTILVTHDGYEVLTEL